MEGRPLSPRLIPSDCRLWYETTCSLTFRVRTPGSGRAGDADRSDCSEMAVTSKGSHIKMENKSRIAQTRRPQSWPVIWITEERIRKVQLFSLRASALRLRIAETMGANRCLRPILLQLGQHSSETSRGTAEQTTFSNPHDREQYLCPQSLVIAAQT